MSIVFQHDKRSNITYAYESKSFWDKEKKQSRAKRTLLGRVDEKTGEIVPTDGRVKNAHNKKDVLDYKMLYEQLLVKCEMQEAEIEVLRIKLVALEG